MGTARRFLTAALLLTLLLPGLALDVRAAPAVPESPRTMQLTLEGPAYLDLGGASNGPEITFLPSPVPTSKLVFQSYRDNNWEIYTAEGDFTSDTRLTFHNAIDRQPRFNRGCTRIAFSSKRSGNYELYTMNPDGSGLIQLTSNAKDDYLPAWSPDGSKIAFVSNRDGQEEIYVMNADGSGTVRLTYEAQSDTQPAWSPDGARIAFTSYRGYVYRIWVMQADGSGPVQLSSQPYSESPAWSPDGSQIAFDADADGEGFQELWRMDADGANQQMIYDTGGQDSAWAYAWSPDQRYVAFTHIDLDPPYWTGAKVQAWDSTQPWLAYDLIGYGLEWNPDWSTTDAWPPSSSVAPLPAQSPGPIAVRWSGSDTGGSGLRSYDIQVRIDGGPWTDWLPGTTATSADYPGIGGHTYAFRSRARDAVYNIEPWPAGADATTTVEALPPDTAVDTLPEYTRGDILWVRWGGEDPGGSGIVSYDVEYQDLAQGIWIPWQSGTTATGDYFPGTLGHRYAFRCQAVDAAANLEPWPASATGDTATTLYAWGIAGTVHDNRGVPLAGAGIAVTPAAFDAQPTADDGTYAQHVAAAADLYTVTWDKAGYGALPATDYVSRTDVQVEIALPPADDVVLDGGFELGDLAVGWLPLGAITPTITTTLVHTGEYAALLGCQGPAFSAPYQVHAAYAARVATDGAGNLHAIWLQSGYGTFIRYARRASDGTWTDLRELGAGQGYSRGIDIAVGPDGAVHAVWEQGVTASNGEIYYARRAGDGSWSPAENLSNSSGASESPHLVVAPSGIVHLVYNDFSGGIGSYYYTQRGLDGNWSPREQFTFSSAGIYDARIALDGSGGLHVGWEDLSADVYYARRGSDGVWTTPLNLSANAYYSWGIQVVLDPDGTAHVVWSDDEGDTAASIRYRRRSPDGTWTAAEMVASSPCDLQEPLLVRAPDGTLHAAWTQACGWSTSVHYAWRSAAGAWSMPEQVSPLLAPDHEAHEPDLVVDATGKVHLAWGLRDGSDTIWVYYASNSSHLWTAPVLLSAHNGYYARPRLAVDDGLRLHVLWPESSSTLGESLHYAGTALNGTAGDSQVSQAVTVSADTAAPTLSFFYRLVGADQADGSWLSVAVDAGLTQTVLLSTTSSAEEWTHAWFDMGPWVSRTVTLTLNLHQEAGQPCVWGYVDEVTLGSAYPDLWVAQAGSSVALPGDTVVFTLVYGNRGAAAAAGAIVSDTLPPELNLIAASMPPVTTPPALRWEVGDLPPGSGPFAIVVTASLTTSVDLGTTVVNWATIGGPAELETANNSAPGEIFIGYRIYLPLVLR